MDIGDPDVRSRLLTEGPVGEWVTLPGTHTVLMSDYIRFDPGGTGEIHSDSVLGGEITEQFTWSMTGPGRLSCTVVDTEPEPEVVGFAFEQQRSDIGAFWVMRDPDFDGFWRFALPVAPRQR